MVSFPAVSVSVNDILCAPSISALVVNVTVPPLHVPCPTRVPPSYTFMMWPFVLHAEVNVGVVSDVMLSVVDVPVSEPDDKSIDVGVVGSTVSIVNINEFDIGDTFPAKSVAMTLMLLL